MKRRAAALALALLAGGCSMPRVLPTADGPVAASSDEVVVIGKVELVPPLDKREQRTHWNAIGEDKMLGRILLATGPQWRPVSGPDFDSAQFQHTLEAKWGVPFAVRMPRQRTYVNGGFTHLDIVQQEKLWFPGGLQFDVPQGARAVYVGTLRYHRNDFNRITRVEVIDERGDVAAAWKGGVPKDAAVSLLKQIR